MAVLGFVGRQDFISGVITVHVPPTRIATGQPAIAVTTADGTRRWVRSITIHGPSRMIQTDEPDQMIRHMVLSFDDAVTWST